MTFMCKLCGKAHEATERDDKPGAPPEERAKLRDDMVKAEELLLKNPGVESYERKAERTAMAYYGSYGGTGVWKIPVNITTSKGANGYYFHCVSCEP